ncbi:Fahd2 [Symbiodinium microadriaticum]|nr:Fahd2 [Symbiodinium microadriaticum]
MAGLSRGPLQYHFPEKNDLFVAIAERLQDNNLRSLIPELKTLPMDEAKVDALLNRLFSIVGTDDQLARMEIQIAMRTDADLRDAVEAIDDQTANQYRAALPEMFPGMNEKTANDIVVFLTTVIRGLSMRPPSKEDKAALPFIQQSVRVARVFDRTYVTNPICMPNRASILTGRMPSSHGTRTNGIPLEWATNTFVRMARNEGYETALIGKAHFQNMNDVPEIAKALLGDEPDAEPWVEPWDQGWETYEYMERHRMEDVDVPEDFYGFDHVDLTLFHSDLCSGHYYRWIEKQGVDPKTIQGAKVAQPYDSKTQQVWKTSMPEELYPTTYVTDRTVEWLEAHKDDDTPFLLQCSYPDPHHPFTPPGKYFDMYDPADIPLPETFWQDHSKSPEAYRQLADNRGDSPIFMAPFGPTEEQFRDMAAKEYGMIAMIDDGVGKVLDALERSGKADNTIVIFTSDHGDMFGDHGLMLKVMMAYDGVLHVPLTIKAPGVKPGHTKSLASSLDIAPTLIDMMNVPSYYGIQGKSLTPVLDDAGASVRDSVLVEEEQIFPDPSTGARTDIRTIITDEGRLSLRSATPVVGELHDHDNDPLEADNIFDDPGAGALRQRLSDQLIDNSQMKLATFTHNGNTRIGIVEDDAVIDLSQAAPDLPTDMVSFLEAGADAITAAKAAAGSDAKIPLSDVTLEAPVLRPGKIMAIGLNYADHVAESGQETPEHQIWFSKAATGAVGPHADILKPVVSDLLDYEAELCVVIGKRARHVPADRAHEVIAGLCVGNDVSVRDWQLRTPQYVIGKSFDTHAPIGPWITTLDEVGDPHALTLKGFVNGEERQNSNTKHLIFNCFDQIAQLSQAMTLEPGDVIFTGTPGGVGGAMGKFLAEGDVVRIEIEKLGAIENKVVNEKLSYGLSEYGKGLFIHGPNLIWLFFLTDVLGIPPATAGLLILAPMIWDAVTDPVMGYVADRTRSKMGKYRPWILFCAPIAATFFVLLFTKPDLDPTGTIIYVLVVAILFRTSFTLVDVPHNGLMGRATQNSGERSLLAGAKMMFGAFAAVTISAAVVPILSGDGAAEQADLFTRFAFGGGIIAIITLYICFLMFKPLDKPNHLATESEAPKLKVGDMLSSLKQNNLLWIALISGVTAVMMIPAFTKSLLYYAKYALGDEAWGGVALVTFSLAMVISIPVWAFLGRKFAKARLLQIGHILAIIMLLIFYFYDGTDRAVLGTIIFIAGLCTGGLNALTLGLVPDLIEYGEWKSGKRVEAGIFGLFTFSTKLGNGLGAGLLGILLGVVGFVANQDQSQETLDGIKAIMVFLPIAGSALVAFLLIFFKLDHATHARITQELEDRRGESRDKLLVAAEKAFSENGYYNTKLTDIAKEAGCAVGTIYKRFTDKDGLFGAVIEAFGQETKAQVTMAINWDFDHGAGLGEILQNFVFGTMDAYIRHYGLYKALIERSLLDDTSSTTPLTDIISHSKATLIDRLSDTDLEFDAAILESRLDAAFRMINGTSMFAMITGELRQPEVLQKTGEELVAALVAHLAIDPPVTRRKLMMLIPRK